MTGLVFDVRKYSIHDGPGIRTTFFLKGCPLSCVWCHNPEGLRPAPELFQRPDRCLGPDACGACLAVCPSQAAAPAKTSETTGSGGLCLVCGACAAVCPTQARQLVGFRLTTEQALAAALEDEPFYDESGGGVTFSGGEPFFQPDFLLECLAAFKARGIHTAVDTSGFAPPEMLEKAAERADLFLFDIKLMDSRAHEQWTGVPNDRILKNLRLLCERGSSIWVRIPLIPGVNDGPDSCNLWLISLNVKKKFLFKIYECCKKTKYRRCL